MRAKTNRPLRSLGSAIAVLGAAIGWSSPSDAYVQQFVVDQTATVNYTPIPLGTSTPGPATSYTVYQGRIFGALDPHNRPQHHHYRHRPCTYDERARLATLPTFRLSRRLIRRSAADC